MPTPLVQIETLQGGAAQTFEVGVQETLLVGRSPDAVELEAECPELPAGHVRAVAVPLDRVSRHHALVHRREGATVVRDLRSTNGTWIHLERGQSLTIEGAPPLRLGLALAGGPSSVTSQPDEPRWCEEPQYAGSMAEAVARWFGELGLSFSVRVIPHVRGGAPVVGSIALRGGKALWIESAGRTADDRLAGVMSRLVAFVTRQNELFDVRVQEQAAGLVLASPLIQATWRDVVAAAKADMRVLLLGPSGAGKTALASSYHRARDPDGPFHAVNCGLLGKNTEWIRAALFGAAPGAYPGCPRGGVRGAVEAANRGTLFLDEVAELDLDAQVALLTFLDDGVYVPLGTVEGQRASVRLVCATNKDLRALVRAGRFREDLWFRIAAAVIEVRPLSERPEDVRAFLATLPEARERAIAARLTDDAWRCLDAQPWTGGFRELRNFVQRLALRLEPEGAIDVARCHAALSAGALVAPALPSALEPAASALATGSPEALWRPIVERSFAMFMASAPEAELTYERLAQFVDDFLKPVFIAHASGLGEAKKIPKEALFQELAERLGCSRGTVRTHLNRFMEINQ